MVQELIKTRRKTGPPAFLAAVVEALTPRAVRQELAGELLSNYSTLASYCLEATRGVPHATFINAVQAFNRRRLIGDIACVFIAFHMLPRGPLAAILVVAALTLLWRDAHTHPPETSVGVAAIDGVILGAAIVAWQLFWLFAASPLAAPPAQFLVGLPVAIAMVAAWRFTTRWEKQRKIEPTDAERAYRDAWRVYLLWIAAVYGLEVGNTRVVVDPGEIRDFLYTFGPMVFFVIAARLQSDRIGGRLIDSVLLPFTKDIRKLENAARATHLFSKRTKTWAEFSQVTLFEGLFFAGLIGPSLFVLVEVYLGWVAVETVNWFQLTVNLAVLVSLSRMWIEIKKIHEKVAAALLAESK